jgi:hypothetical protein
MRKVIENQLKIGQVDISSINIDLNCRDEIPQLLLGLQAIYTDRRYRDEVFGILKKSFLPMWTWATADPGWICGRYWYWGPCD